MKNLFSILIILFIIFNVFNITLKETKNQYYALATCVIKVDENNDLVTCEDCNGNLWKFYGCEDWREGDCANLLMNDRGTLDIKDDVIESVCYSTWILTR